MADTDLANGGIAIFRAEEAPDLMAAGCMSIEPFTPAQSEAMGKLVAEGYSDGDEIKVLCNIPGFSLTHVWFKKDFPLPLHSHDADCLYYIIAGSLRLGNDTLGPRDSFFVPSNVPYTYKPGPDGVEVLEIRHANHFNFVNLAKSEAFWNKAVATVAANRAEWQVAKRPSMQ
jgi:hypothetical protein